jgi:hypothetical protein
MAAAVKYFEGTEAQILALEPTDSQWVDKAFYYPTDKTYFYRILNGEMTLYGGGDASISGVGVTLNDKIIGGVKSYIEEDDVLVIPENYEYNVFNLKVDGVINNSGLITIM